MRTVAVSGEQHAGGHGLPILDDGAAAAGALVAGLLGRGQTQPVPQGFQQRFAAGHLAEMVPHGEGSFHSVDE